MDDHDGLFIFFSCTQAFDDVHMASSPNPLFRPRFWSQKPGNFRRSSSGPDLAHIFYLGKLRPNSPSHLNLGGGFEPKPPKPLLARLCAMHSGWSTMVTPSFLARRGCLTANRRSYTAIAIPPLRVPSSHGRPTSSILII